MYNLFIFKDSEHNIEFVGEDVNFSIVLPFYLNNYYFMKVAILSMAMKNK